MVNALIGRKVGMTSVYDAEGNRTSVTLLEMGPCTVTQVKKADGSDGYNSVQLGFEPLAFGKLNKPMKGKFEKAGLKEGFRVLREFRTDIPAELEIGALITADELFKEKGCVKVIGTSKGAGFAGGMKRHNFSGAKASHGQEKVHRKPMSAGSTDAARVFKGKRSPGHMGDQRVTVKNLEIVRLKALDVKAGTEGEEAKSASGKYILALKGSVPGKRNSLVVVQNV